MKQVFALLLLLVASLFWGQTPRLVVPIGHTGPVSSVAFSPDGKTVLTGSYDNTAKLWDLSGRELQTFSGHDAAVISLAFSPDGKQVLTGDLDSKVKLWDLSGIELTSFSGDDGPVGSVAFSPNGKQVLIGFEDAIPKLWDLSSEELQDFIGHADAVRSVAFSPVCPADPGGGKQVLTSSDDNTAKLWDLSGRVLQTFSGHAAAVNSAAFSPDGQQVLTGSDDKTAKLWDLSGRELQTFTGHATGILSVAFTHGGKRILTVSRDNLGTLWDLSGRVLQTFTCPPSEGKVVFSPNGKQILAGGSLSDIYDNTAKLCDLSGRVLQIFTGHATGMLSGVFSPDGKQILTVSGDHTAKLWDLLDRELQTISGPAAERPVVFSPDGKQVLTTSGDGTAKLYDLSGRELQTFTAGDVYSVAFSPDGKNVLTHSVQGTSKLWDLSGKELHTFTAPADGVRYVAFSPDGKQVLTGYGVRAMLWDLSGQELQDFIGHGGDVHSVAFSPDGKTVLTGSSDGTSILWDLSGQLLQYFGHAAAVRSVAFSPDCPTDPGGGKYVLTSSDDLTAKVWDTHTGNLLATLIAIDSTDWVVTTPSGLFDASPGAMKRMHYMIGLEAIELDQLKNRYFEPGLLPKLLGFTSGGLRPVEELNNVPLFPEILEASIKNDTLRVRLKARSGGIGRVALLRAINQEIVVDANPQRKTDFEIDLKPYASQIFNNLYLRLYNQEGWLRSQLYPLEYSPDGVGEKGPGERRSLNQATDAKLEEINFYALVVGTSKFRGTQLNLKYPDLDAASFADALQQAGNQLFSKDRTHVHLLSTETEPWPRKAEIQKALRDIDAKATVKDILLIYLSGHGITYPPNSEKGQFYYLTTDIAGDKLDDPAVLNAQAIGLDSLMEWVRPIDANKRILILDACNSGSVVEKLEPGAKELNSDQRRALEEANERSGMYVLAGSAADKSSYEASSYGHGLLTYSLLKGMLEVAAKNNKKVELGDLFTHVEDEVPVLAKNINRVQKPEVIKTGSYPIGIIDSLTGIKMPIERPVFVRTGFTYSKRGKDLLDLSSSFNKELDQASAKKDPTFVFWDVASYSGKYYYLGGEYQTEGENVKGTAFLYRENEELHTFPFTGSKANLDKLVKDLIFEVQEYLANNPGK